MLLCEVIITAWIVLVAAAVLSFGQTTTRKSASASKPDNWQKSKECAAQAEKVMADKPGSWENHYSPKYDRCFISKLIRVPGERAGKDYPETVNQLLDAFERATLAQWVSEYPQSEGPLNSLSCHIDYEPTKCAKVRGFIAERMKN